MKQVLIGFIVTIIIGLLVWFLFLKPEIDMPDTSARETELVGIVDSLTSHIATLEKERDSLLTIPPKIDKQIVYRERQIDENIAKDSSRAIVEYRKALQDNGDLPESGEYLSFREIGLGAKNMARLPSLRLKIKTYEEIAFKDEVIISDLKYQIGGYIELNEMQKESVKYYKALYDKESAWYNSNYVWFGLGVVGAGLAVFLAGGLQ